MKQLGNKDLISLEHLSASEVYLIFEKAVELRERRRKGFPTDYLEGKTLAMIFEKPSLRTRVSFAVAMRQLGGQAIELPTVGIHEKEAIQDIARVLSSYVDGIMIRCYQQRKVELYAKYTSIPVINGLSDDLHPCQTLSDLFTLYEKVKDLKGLTLTFIGRPNNITNSLMEGCSIMGINLVVCYPKELTNINPEFYNYLKSARNIYKRSGSSIKVTHDIREAVKNTNAIYTDVWINAGENLSDAEKTEIMEKMLPYQVNRKLMDLAPKNTLFLHCLPAERGKEVSSEVIDNDKISLVWDQSKNRLHIQKAILYLLMAPEFSPGE